MSMSSYIKQEMVERSEQEEDLNIAENLRSFCICVVSFRFNVEL